MTIYSHCKRKRIFLISQATISMIYFPNTSAPCAEVEAGNCFSSPGGAEAESEALSACMSQ